MKRIRVFLAAMPPILHDIVRGAVSDQLDMELVRGDLGDTDLVRAFRNGEIDVVIAGERQSDPPAIPRDLFVAAPCGKVLVIAPSGRNAVMYQLRPEKRSLGDVSPQNLIDAIRTQL